MRGSPLTTSNPEDHHPTAITTLATSYIRKITTASISTVTIANTITTDGNAPPSYLLHQQQTCSSTTIAVKIFTEIKVSDTNIRANHIEASFTPQPHPSIWGAHTFDFYTSGEHKHAFGENLFKFSICFLNQDFVWYSLIEQPLSKICFCGSQFT